MNFIKSTKCTLAEAENIPISCFEFVPFPTILGGGDETFLIGKFYSENVVRFVDIAG